MVTTQRRRAPSAVRPTAPRLPALRLDELDDRQRQLVGLVDPQFTTVPNAVLTLVRDPALYEAFLPLATKLLIDSAFSGRHRELVILRTAEFDEHQLVQLPMLVGQYHLMAFVLNALGVQPEPGSTPLP